MRSLELRLGITSSNSSWQSDDDETNQEIDVDDDIVMVGEDRGHSDKPSPSPVSNISNHTRSNTPSTPTEGGQNFSALTSNASNGRDSDSSSDDMSSSTGPSRRQIPARRKNITINNNVNSGSSGGSFNSNGPIRKRRSGISARERNLRRLESNERERMRMHSLNDAFEVRIFF